MQCIRTNNVKNRLILKLKTVSSLLRHKIEVILHLQLSFSKPPPKAKLDSKHFFHPPKIEAFS